MTQRPDGRRTKMILAEKIMSLRKRAGWSQEELASQLGVSRQSVSKWESALSIPDIAKITQLSELFGVTTDYLLKDEIEDLPVSVPQMESGYMSVFPEDEPKKRQVSMEEANDYLELTEQVAPKTALGVMLCIWSPIVLIMLGGLSDMKNAVISENAAAAIGVAVLLIMIAAAVAIFIIRSSKLNRFDYLEKEEIELLYGVEAAVRRKKESFENAYRVTVATGVGIILAGVAQLVAIGALTEGGPEIIPIISLCVMLLMIGCAVYLFVKNGMINESCNKLLQLEDYTPENKAVGRRIGWVPGAYWSLATAIYLGISFITDAWDRSWIVWPVAGVLYAAIYGVFHASARNRIQNR